MARLINPGLFGSPTRSRALVLVGVLGQTFAPEVSRLLGTSLSEAQRALASLERAGVVESRLMGSVRLYTLSARCPYKSELEALLQKLASLQPELLERSSEIRRRPRRAGKALP